MPELPEVEVIRRDLQAEVVGRRIAAAAVADTPNARRIVRRHAHPAQLEEPLRGALITALARRGKYLLFQLDEQVLVAHLGMSGQLLVDHDRGPDPKHTHVVLDLGPDGLLRYVDPRAFGEMFVAERDELGDVPELARLGRDPMVDGLELRYLEDAFARRRTSAKPLLMDQTFICGLGNIYSDEVLFLSGVRHDRAAPLVSGPELRRMQEAIPAVLNEAIQGRGTSIADEQYRDPYGRTGGYQARLRVYGREGMPCPACGTPIRRGRWSNRSSFYCPVCQR